jgi:hypothetical protein
VPLKNILVAHVFIAEKLMNYLNLLLIMSIPAAMAEKIKLKTWYQLVLDVIRKRGVPIGFNLCVAPLV